MDKDDLIRKANKSKYIPGIYNYCDRWCERCPFTARCLNYEIGEEQFSTVQNRDIKNKEFWQQLGDLFASTLQMIKEELEERGINIENINTPEYEKQDKEQQEYAKKHILAKKSLEYSEKVKDWFDESDAYLQQKGYDLNKFHELRIKNEDAVIDITDAIEVIHWYQYQIHVKIRRALHGKHNELVKPKMFEGIPSDADGSAKVVLIGIDRSIAAWGKLYTHFPEKEDSILNILVLLEKLRKGIEVEFPNARAFVRPGFDEGYLNE